MNPPSTIACTIVLPFRFVSFKTSSACDGWSTCCSTKSSATCFSFMLTHVSESGRDHFFGAGQATENFANPVLAQGAHAKLARALPQIQSGAAFIDHVPDFVIEHENLKDSHATFVTGAAALVAAFAAHDLRVAQLSGFDPERAHFGFSQFGRLAATGANSPNESLRHDRAQR